MKFPQLPVGTRFEFEGKVYVKTGPIAAADADGRPRMIPRYAVLRAVDGSFPAVPPPAEKPLDKVVLQRAFEGFCQSVDRVLDAAVEDDARLHAAREGVRAARHHFWADLGLGGTPDDPTS